jgi:uncharacterized protein YbjT (DUF2867 family)
MSFFANNPLPVLVIGATGTVGKEVVRVLLRRGASVTALLRARPRGASLPEAVEVVTGDLGDADAVRRAVERAGVVFFVNPHEAEEETYAEHVLAACEQTNTRLVFLGVHVDARWAWLRAVLRTTYGAFFPHYKRRFRIGERIFSAATKTQLLLASAFFQNDEVFHDDILAGRYTQPLGVKGVTQVDVRDIAEVAATVLLDPSHPAGCFPITGPTSVSGPEAAAIWAEALGHEVVYAGHEREAWQNAIRTHLTGHKREDWLKTYEALAKMSGGPDPKELARTTELLGRPPRSYRDYVTDIAVTVAARRPARAA